MWILAGPQPGGDSHYLLSSKDYIVGRKNCDIVLPNDQSISRAHALLTATDQSLTLKDTSKYGTSVNGQRVAVNTSVNVTSGDVVTFGVFDSKFTVVHLKPLVCSSCLDNDGKASLTQALVGLGGKLVNTWSQDCTHLIMPTVKVTIKTISALLCGRPIVKPEFFSELSKAVHQKLPLPKAENFVPEIDEPSLNKEDVNLGEIPARKQLFTKKTFIFLSAKQLKRLSAAVAFGGGSSRLLDEGSLPRDLLESPQSCVVDVTTANSQMMLPPSSTEWANSVKNIVQRKGLRLIPEAEIGLAAIFASCDKYCNSSSLIPDSESVQKVKPRIPSASLSQNAAVDETVLPAASQNIEAYALNTEPPERMQLCGETGVTAVGETPEKKQKENSCQLRGAKLTASQCVVAETMSSSLHTVENSQKRKPESKLRGEGSSAIRPQTSTNKTDCGMKTFLQRQSPQKQKISAQTSPQKQSTLTSYFQAVNKKRPLEGECSPMSESKRPLLEPSISMKAPDAETYSRSDRVPAATLQTTLETRADPFTGRPDAFSRSAQEETRSRKRKEMEAEIQMDELMSIMSEDMDCFEEQPSDNKQAELTVRISAEQKQRSDTAAVSSLTKRQRVPVGENGTNQKPLVSLENDSRISEGLRPKPEQHIISIKEEQVHPSEYMATNHDSSKHPERSSGSKSQDLEPFEEYNDPSFIEDVELLKADMCQAKEETRTPVKPATVKQEPKESQIDENLPKKQILVEFRSLTVTAPPKTKPKPSQSSRYKNFKCFRKCQVPGAGGLPHIIGGSDLLVHNRGENSDLDEWMKDAAEEERQSRQDETAGDDLFRYNPTKLAKRR